MVRIGAAPPLPWQLRIPKELRIVSTTPADSLIPYPGISRPDIMFGPAAVSVLERKYTNFTSADIPRLLERERTQGDLRFLMFDNLNLLVQIDMSETLTGGAYQFGKTNEVLGTGNVYYWRCIKPCTAPTMVRYVEGRGPVNYIRHKIAPKVLKVLLKSVPVFGTLVNDGIAPAIVAAVEYVSKEVLDFIAEEIEELLKFLSDILIEIFADIDLFERDTTEKAIKEFNLSGKMIVDTLKPVVLKSFDPQTILGFITGKGQLSLAANVMSNDVRSFDLLLEMAQAGTKVRDWSSWRLWLDIKKSFALMQAAVGAVMRERGQLRGDQLREFVAAYMRNDANAIIESDGALMSREALSFSNGLVEMFAGKPEVAWAMVDSRVLGQLIPDQTRRDKFMLEMSRSLRFDASLGPIMNVTAQQYWADIMSVQASIESLQDRFGRDLTQGRYPPYEGIRAADRDAINTIREANRNKLIGAITQANMSIRAAADQARPLIDMGAAARAAALKDYQAYAKSKGCYYRGGPLKDMWICPSGVMLQPAPQMKWPFEFGPL